VLALTRTAIGAGELASRANLNRTSVYPALVALEGTGMVAQIERDADVTIEIRGTTRSELLSRPETTAAQLREAILLAGIPPGALRPDTTRTITPKLRSHEEHDLRARRLAVAIAAKLKRDPELIRTARQHLDKRERTASTREQRVLQEWARILSTMSPNRLQRFLIEPSERATRLRQSLPLLDVLSSTERDAVLASTTDAEARAVVSGKYKRSPAT